jgi:hypothetical protein
MRCFRLLLAGIFISTLSGIVCALPFDITANNTLPTTYPSLAAYTITNNTSYTTGHLIKHLPTNTSIFASGTTCATSLNTGFNLNQGASCTLNLLVSGVINRNDPNPHHHLTICLADNVSCAGPNLANSLNVTDTAAPTLSSISITPTNPSVVMGSTEQLTATGIYSDGSTANLTNTVAWSSNTTQYVTIESSGGANPGLATAVAAGSATINAQDQTTGVQGSTTLTVTTEYAFLVTAEGPGSGPNASLPGLYACPIDMTSGTVAVLANCIAAPFNNTNISTIYSVAFDATHGVVYTVDIESATDYVYGCPFSNGAFSTCSKNQVISNTPRAIALDPTNSYLYLSSGGNSLYIYNCPITDATTGAVGTCTQQIGPVAYARGIATLVIGDTTYGYVAETVGGGASMGYVQAYTINSNTGGWNGYATAAPDLYFTIGSTGSQGNLIAFDNSGHADIMTADAVTQCTIETTGSDIGLWDNCTEILYPIPNTALAVDPTSSYLYIAGNNQIETCSLGSDGSIGTCVTSDNSTFPKVTGIIISPPSGG